jgi:hypothetical protein
MPENPAGRTIVVCKYQPELLRALLDFGASVYLVLDRLDRFNDGPDEQLVRRCRKVYHVSSFDSLEELSSVAVDVQLAGPAVDLVVSQHELSQFGAGYLGLLLGTGTDPLAHVSHRDKRLMKQRVRAAGVTTARFASVPDQHDEAAVAVAPGQLGWPLIVKPAAGYGSMNTLKVADQAAFAKVVADFKFEALIKSRHLIVEEFIPGDELAVDAIWSAGEELTLVVHRYHQPRMTITETSMDGLRVLRAEDHPQVYERIRAMHVRVNAALGILNGATHMELFVRPDGELIFSEIATRVGGAWHPAVLSAYHGRSIWHLLAEAALTGTCPKAKPVHPYLATVSLRPARAGTITEMPTDAELAALAGVVSWERVRQVGQKARLSHPSDHYLHVVLGAESEAALEERCRLAFEHLVIRTAE